MNTIIKTITKKVNGLSLYSVEKLDHINLNGFTFIEQHIFNGYNIITYENSLIKEHVVTITIFQMSFPHYLGLLEIKDGVSKGKLGWTKLIKSLNRIPCLN